jgi:hypothetical protein
MGGSQRLMCGQPPLTNGNSEVRLSRQTIDPVQSESLLNLQKTRAHSTHEIFRSAPGGADGPVNLKRIRCQRFQLLVMTPAGLEPNAAPQNDQILSMPRWLKLLDPTNIHNQRPVDAQEHLRIK